MFKIPFFNATEEENPLENPLRHVVCFSKLLKFISKSEVIPFQQSGHVTRKKHDGSIVIQ